MKLLLAVAAFLIACSASALDLQGLQNSHDPGTIVKDHDTYFHFTTGTNGIWYSTSTDLVNWGTTTGNVFSSTSYPSWITSNFPNWSKGSFWAPDVIKMNGYFYLYYSVTDTFGNANSAIGVARSPSLKNPVWTDLGIVVQSSGGAGANVINAIDPAVFRDHDGKVYLTYGSFFNGIGVAEINQGTGKLATNVTHLIGGNGLDMEGAYITRNKGYYYLFVNRGACCTNPLSNTTYYVEVYRSTSVTGPYTGGNVYNGTNTVMPNVDGAAPTHKGPGHVGVLKKDGCNYVSTHYVDTSDGNAKLQLMLMTYDTNDWPVLTRNFTSIASCGGISDDPYVFTSALSGKAITVANASTTNGALVQQLTYSGAQNQKWYVIGHGDGYYSIINANSLLSMDDYNNSTTAGTNIAQWGYWAGNGQQWSFASAGSGYFTVKNLLSGMVLDVQNKSTADNAQIIQYPSNGGTNQKWAMDAQ
ncbi:family 43 glycosylhydrolase [Massilia sp. TW-1]|uniref:Family 43 glycosylhydrolase n=1 Tax=Telluria antibiotica TaxID=2717319 RepID=A0ABX0PDT0_9BURK|nr:family 43 glycosylhydrolase [Telluria antibiotica]NIA54669.1 family 43 glycosylhydrolase [Telluria antibiotica]